MTLTSVQSRGKRDQTGVFDYTDEDERVEEESRKILQKYESSRDIDKYEFLRIYAQGSRSKSKVLDHIIIDVEVPAKEEHSKCELSGDGTGDLIDVISDGSHGRIGINSSASSSLSEEATSSASDPLEVDSENSQVLITPDFIIYGDIYCTNSRLTFSRNCVAVESKSVNATKETFTCQWTIEDIIKIESQWCLMLETAIVNVLLKSRDTKEVDRGKEISGIDLLKFSVYNPNWSEEVEKIKLLDSRYTDIWCDTITDSEESASTEQNMETSLTNLADSFEDIIYPKGDPDAVEVRKQDIELLKPRRFINDTIIDFYIKYIKSRVPPEDRGRFHFFNCFFFRKLANLDKGTPSSFGGKEAYQRVQKWTKNVDLFEKDYIFIPINCSLHWSLIIICHPGESVPSHVENPPRVPCILHLDSIKGSHGGGLINIFPRNHQIANSNALKRMQRRLNPIFLQGSKLTIGYLHEEWKARHGDTTIGFPKAPNMQFISLELPQQGNSFDCGLFLLHYLDLFVAQAPAKFNPSLITRSGNFLTRNWFPAKEASQKRGHILELLYNLHKGHDLSILPASSKSKPLHCGDSIKNDQENESKQVNEICSWKKTFDGSSSYTPEPKTCSSTSDIPDLILTKEKFHTGGYDPEACKRRKLFMSPIVEESTEKETNSPMDIEESLIDQETEMLRKEDFMLCIEDTDDEETVSVAYVSDSQDSYEDELKEEDDDELLLVADASKEIQRTTEIKSASPSIEKGVNKSRDLVSQDSYEDELKEVDDDGDELLLVSDESKETQRTIEIKSASPSIERGVNKSRDLVPAFSCYKKIIVVLSDDERSSGGSNDFKDRRRKFLTPSSKCK